MGENASSNTEKRKSLVFRLVLFVGLSIIFFNFLQIIVTGKITKKSVLSDTAEDYAVIASAYSQLFQEKMNVYFSELDYYLRADVVSTGNIDAIKKWLLAHEGERSELFDYVLVVGADGICTTDTGPTADISDRSYFKAIMQEGKTKFVADPLVSKTTGKTIIHIAHAIVHNGKTIGLFAGIVDVKHLDDVATSIKVGKTGYAVILSDDGTVLSHPNKDWVMKRNFLTGYSKGHEDMGELAKQMVAGKTGTAWIKGFSEALEFVSFTPIQGTHWSIGIFVLQSEIYSSITSMMGQMTWLSIISAILLVSIAGFLMYRAIKPLNKLDYAITKIASGNADLTQRIEINSNNEIGFVVKGFNKFVGKLQEIISDVKNSKNELSSAGEVLEESTQNTSSAITQILANIDSVRNQIVSQSSSVEETAGAVNEIASNISSLERMIENQTAGVSQASAAVEQMIGNISSVNQSVDKMASSFSELQSDAQNGFSKQQVVNEQIEKIEKQSAMLQEANAAISSIASQTNLLAMNAAIEAAHAGEAGKGFSVVADEIRKLSETSTSQSKTIGDQLNNIRESIDEVVASSAESSSAFENVSKKIKDTDQLVVQIKSAMEEQTEGSKQINEALHSMNDSSSEVRNASSEMSAGNQAILEEVKRLQDATMVMKESMDEMAVGAKKINETGAALSEISSKVKGSISNIADQIDRFRV
ncbi:methyl-accepting chemotaxis protein [uncultured Treponema sp.]|uniref:methyl-accepting chemotaxis protein n=1 Tax=uncultured Treponema sp. TaxID=162155 RepID=UPI0025DDF1DF|nr:methyl-accepting chemotaxis protein [uncultured Treponema sp.]